MSQQMTPEGIMVLALGLVVFWIGVATTVRLHQRRSARSDRGQAESRG